jgi:probable HAF family extracellular repeat protein
LGGNFSGGVWLNEACDIVGSSSLPGDTLYHATLWSDGKISDIDSVGQGTCSEAFGINSSHQVVGVFKRPQCGAFQQGGAFLWENGGPMVDLNALVYPPSPLHMYLGFIINDRGEIGALAQDPSGNYRVALLVPDGDCDDDCEQRIADSQNAPPVQPATRGVAPAYGRPADWLRNPLGNRYPMPGRPAAPSN